MIGRTVPSSSLDEWRLLKTGVWAHDDFRIRKGMNNGWVTYAAALYVNDGRCLFLGEHHPTTLSATGACRDVAKAIRAAREAGSA